mmetsp:Transcript_57641/g.134241  ORF Transcript_57641/g.134241 Transcript_57641/m.134241 type:complete len:199 (+) Transcript_57641:1974-2570(+)
MPLTMRFWCVPRTEEGHGQRGWGVVVVVLVRVLRVVVVLVVAVLVSVVVTLVDVVEDVVVVLVVIVVVVFVVVVIVAVVVVTVVVVVVVVVGHNGCASTFSAASHMPCETLFNQGTDHNSAWLLPVPSGASRRRFPCAAPALSVVSIASAASINNAKKTAVTTTRTIHCRRQLHDDDGVTPPTAGSGDVVSPSSDIEA